MQSTATGDVDGGIGGSEILPLLGSWAPTHSVRVPHLNPTGRRKRAALREGRAAMPMELHARTVHAHG